MMYTSNHRYDKYLLCLTRVDFYVCKCVLIRKRVALFIQMHTDGYGFCYILSYIIFLVINLFLLIHTTATYPVQRAVQTITGAQNIYDTSARTIAQRGQYNGGIDRYPYRKFSLVNVNGWELKLFGTK